MSSLINKFIEEMGEPLSERGRWMKEMRGYHDVITSDYIDDSDPYDYILRQKNMDKLDAKVLETVKKAQLILEEAG